MKQNYFYLNNFPSVLTYFIGCTNEMTNIGDEN